MSRGVTCWPCSDDPQTTGQSPGIKGGPCVPLQAAYLQKLGVNTAVFERRHVIGGAAVTEEIIPGEPQEVVWGAAGSHPW